MSSHVSVASESSEAPWYRHRWPWILISIPAVSVVLGIMMIYLGLQTNNSLVVDDYYKQGKAINQRIERDQTAVRLGVDARLARAPDGLQLSLSAEQPLDWPADILVRWVHTTRAELDGQTRFVGLGEGHYVAAGKQLPTDGHYRLHIEPLAGDWRLVSPVLDLSAIDPEAGIVVEAPRERFPVGSAS